LPKNIRMEPAEFEEKEFEGPLYNELLLGSRRFATPGQVFENAFGIDAALEAQHPIFWDRFGYRDIPDGISLNHYRWGWVWRRHGGYRELPSFPVNLLIQSKRPDFLHGRRGDFADRGIAGHYWRFFTREHQQEMLERLVQQLRHRALVVYASPAFHTVRELYQHTEAGTVSDHTSYVSPDRLANHSSWNYDTPGTTGIAASEPEFVKEQALEQRLEALGDQTGETDPLTDLEFFDDAVSATVRDAEDNPYAEFFLSSEDRLLGFIRELGEVRKEVLKFTRVGRLYSMLGLNWLVTGKESSRLTRRHS